MKIKVQQHDLIVNIRYAKACDYYYSYSGYKNERDLTVFYCQDLFNKIKKDDRKIISVYCKWDHLNTFFNNIKRFDKKIILVTGCSDGSVTKNIFDLKPSNIIKWYAENVDYKNDILIPIPLGTISGTWIGNSIKEAEANRHKKFNLVKVDDEEKTIKNLVFMCFSINTNEKHRRKIYNYFNNKDWVTNMCSEKTGKYLEDSEFLKNTYNHPFTISPAGNGIDCGRTWIALQTGSIPVIPYHFSLEDFAENLPIILYKDINEITEEYLREKLKEFNQKKFSYDYLKISYWKNRFLQDKNIFKD